MLTNRLKIKHPDYALSSNLVIPAAFVVLISLLLFLLTRLTQFSNDDFVMIRQLNSEKISLADNLSYFTINWGLEGAYYTPLPRLFWFLEYRLFGTSATGWHILSTLIHAACTLLIWTLALRLTRRTGVAVCAGLFFAVQPVHVSAVSQIVGQADLLVTLFCLASTICFVIARQTLIRPYYLGSIGFFALALLCKQQAIALPFALLGYELIMGGFSQKEPNQPKNNLQAVLLLHAPFFGLLALHLLFNMVVLGGLSAFLPTIGQNVNVGEVLSGNVSLLGKPFGLGGTDGLILLAALGAFVALTGVQEWEAWVISHPPTTVVTPTKPVRVLDEEMDDPQTINEPKEVETIDLVEQKETVEAVSEPLKVEPMVAQTVELTPMDTDAKPISSPPVVTPPIEIANPPYWSLRTAGFGFLWSVLFMLPFLLMPASDTNLYPASVGFALFLGAALSPFTTAIAANAKPEQARTLFGVGELSFWMRMAAIAAVSTIYFVVSVGAIDELSRLSRTFGMLIN